MFVKSVLVTACALCTIALTLPSARAEVLDTSAKAPRSSAAMPARGLSMAQVERRYGAPLEKLPSAGGDAPRHPTINRWRYRGYTVYFERNRVLHSVRDDVAPKS